MAFSINSFRSNALSKAGARPNLFECGITGQGLPANFSYLCKIATIPPSTMGVVEVPYFGRMVKIPGNRTFDNLSVTVLNDEDFAVRNAIEIWMNKMNSHILNTAVNPSGLFADMTVTHYGRDGTLITGAVWTFKNAFPVALGEIGLDWGSNDAIEEFSIDFAYDYWSHGAQTT